MLMNPLSIPVEDNIKSESAARVEDEKGSRHFENVSIEDAIRATGHGKFHTILLLVCGFGMMGVVVENVNIGFVLPYIRCEMEISTTEQGFLNSVGYVGIVISSHFWGFLADTSGRRQVLIVSMAGSFISAVLSTLSFNVIMLIVSRLFVGIFVSGVQAATYSYIGEFHSNDTRTRALSFVSVFMPVCFIYLPLLAYFIIPMQWKILIHTFTDFQISPWRLYLLCSSLLNGINLICLFKLPESPKFLLSINQKKSAMIVLKQMYAVNTGKNPETYPIKDIANEQSGTALSEVNGILGVLKLAWNQTWPLFMPPHLGKTIKLCYLMFILFSIGHGTFMWYPDFLTRMQDYVNEPYTLCQVVASRLTQLTNSRHLSLPADVSHVKDCNIDSSNTLAFEIILVMGIAFVSISSLISFYIDKVDRRKLLICWLVVCAVFACSISAIRQFYVMAVCFMVFLSCGLCGGIISAISVALFPTNIRAMATCLILMFGRLGAVSGSNFVSFLINTNCELIFYLYGALILSCAALCFFLNINPTEKRLSGDNP